MTHYHPGYRGHLFQVQHERHILVIPPAPFHIRMLVRTLDSIRKHIHLCILIPRYRFGRCLVPAHRQIQDLTLAHISRKRGSPDRNTIRQHQRIRIQSRRRKRFRTVQSIPHIHIRPYTRQVRHQFAVHRSHLMVQIIHRLGIIDVHILPSGCQPVQPSHKRRPVLRILPCPRNIRQSGHPGKQHILQMPVRFYKLRPHRSLHTP
ncbi:unknown [Tannerella sp. CAG:118]|nr:unknown [Tannerella sp. CAG:118]